MPGNFHVVPEWVLEHWPEPNYVDPVRRSWMPAFAIVFPAVSTVLIAGRFWLRATKQAGSFGLDDLFIAIGWVRQEMPMVRVREAADTAVGGLTWTICHGDHRHRVVRSRPTYVGRPTGVLFGCRAIRLDRASLVPHQYLRDEDLSAALLPPHGRGHLQPAMDLRDLGRAGLSRRLLYLHPDYLLLHLPAADGILGELQLRL